jgi:hypothetical protein
MHWRYVISISLIICTHVLKGQGCSDAGFCTLSGFKPHTDSAASNTSLKIGLNTGKADNAINVFGSYIELNRRVSKTVTFDVKLTTLSQSGNDVSTFGLSDLYLNANYMLGNQFSLTAGMKLPLTNGNKKQNDLALPMDYQSSLGTFDLILGAGYKFRKWQFIWAYQQPLTQNKNTFLAEEYSSDSPLSTFQSTNQFERKGDMLIRISYPIHVTNRLKLTPGLLPIYHLGNDSFVNALGERQEIKGSDGLTLNGNLYLDAIISRSSVIQISAGIPFIVRETRPDGLTRSFVINLEYAVKF